MLTNPRFGVQNVHLDSENMDFTINMQDFMNPSPYTVTEATSAPRLFRMFRALGLRHLTVVNLENRVSGIITRKDLIREHTH